MRIIILVLAFLLFTAPVAVEAQVIKVDLIQATLNGRAVVPMTVDDVTSVLGRPTQIEDNRVVADVMGPQLHYHNSGMTFWFNGRKSDRPGQLWFWKIYFNKTRPPKATKYFEPFNGQITKNMNGNWTVQKTMSEFAAYNPKMQTPEEMEQAAKKEGRYDPRQPVSYWVLISFKGFDLSVLHDPTSKFLEQVSIVGPDPK